MALTLLVSTTGLSVHAVYCLCKGELSYSLVHLEVGEMACAMSGEEAESCCGPGEGCGPASQVSDCCREPGDDHACRTEETIYTRLASVFLVQLDQQDEITPVWGDFGGSFWPTPEPFMADSGERSKSPPGPLSRGGPWSHYPAYVSFQQFRC
ncbi:MAG: hypothetical protein J5I41_02660 [Saprospiraceae bacterium]|nr:hypothetical protein [Saprospiraceae bacterium]